MQTNGGVNYMKKIILKEQVKLKGIKNFNGKDRMIDFYITSPGRDDIYAFSRKYSNSTYDICKSGVRVNEISTKRSRNRSVMGVVKYLNVVLPYLTECYGLEVVS